MSSSSSAVDHVTETVENVAKKFIGGVDAKTITERLGLLQQDVLKFSDLLDKKLASFGMIYFLKKMTDDLQMAINSLVYRDLWVEKKLIFLKIFQTIQFNDPLDFYNRD